MPTIAITIPQLGEGLQEARLIATLKQPGERVRRDEPIYQMETDKAVMDVESPYEGVLTAWLAEADAILPIGGEVALMDVAEAPSTEQARQPAAEGCRSHRGAGQLFRLRLGGSGRRKTLCRPFRNHGSALEARTPASAHRLEGPGIEGRPPAGKPRLPARCFRFHERA